MGSDMKLLKGSIISIGAMFVFVVLSFLIFGIGNELQVVTVLGAAVVAAVLLPIVFVLWGLPMHFFMQKIGIKNVIAYSIVGALPGAVFITIFEPFGAGPLALAVVQSMFCSFVGAVGSVSFWYLVVYRGA